MEKKTCIFGGAFDPIHNGHLSIVNAAIKHFSLDRVLWVPTRHSPHKEPSRVDFKHRLNMINTVLARNPRHIVSDIESRLPRPSYTVNTITSLKAKYGAGDHWFMLIGADNWQIFKTWHQWQKIMKEVQIIIFPRAQYPINSLPEGVEVLGTGIYPETSTAIRQSIKNREPLEKTGVLPEIKEYIQKHHLYSK